MFYLINHLCLQLLRSPWSRRRRQRLPYHLFHRYHTIRRSWSSINIWPSPPMKKKQNVQSVPLVPILGASTGVYSVQGKRRWRPRKSNTRKISLDQSSWRGSTPQTRGKYHINLCCRIFLSNICLRVKVTQEIILQLPKVKFLVDLSKTNHLLYLKFQFTIYFLF